VDIHVARTDESHLNALLARSVTEGPLHASSALASALVSEQEPQLNLQMALGAGVSAGDSMGGSMQHMPMLRSSAMHPEPVLSSSEHVTKFGLASLPSTVLAESGGSQVFQFALPMKLKPNDMIGVFFTYCTNGTDCDSQTNKTQKEHRTEKGLTATG
jgi:hypothetical protein